MEAKARESHAHRGKVMSDELAAIAGNYENRVGRLQERYGIAKAEAQRQVLPKSPYSIQGLDEIIGGGLQKGRPTLVCGSASRGKTHVSNDCSLPFLVRQS